jgi:hypothetical protein
MAKDNRAVDADCNKRPSNKIGLCPGTPSRPARTVTVSKPRPVERNYAMSYRE